MNYRTSLSILTLKSNAKLSFRILPASENLSFGSVSRVSHTTHRLKRLKIRVTVDSYP